MKSLLIKPNILRKISFKLLIITVVPSKRPTGTIIKAPKRPKIVAKPSTTTKTTTVA